MLSGVLRERFTDRHLLGLVWVNHKTGYERTCGRREAAAKGNRKRELCTSSWEYVCSGVLYLLASE